jgi:RNA polymerase sigma-70 factor, ECF subfamily
MHEPPDRTRLEDASDAVVASRAADGDVRAFEVLVRRFAPLLRAYARRTLGSTDELDDVVQEAFVTAWQRLDDLQDPAKVKSWLMRILSHRCVDRIRARRDQAPIDDVDVAAPDEHAPERVAMARSRAEALDVALDALPEPQRRCWIMKEALEYSYDEIAAEFGVPPSTVRGLLARARKNMIVLMEGWR